MKPLCLLLLMLLLSLALGGCASPAPPVAPTGVVIVLPQPSQTPIPTITPVPPTATPTITLIPPATFTPVPTWTEMPPISTFLPTLESAAGLTGTLGVTTTRQGPAAFIPAVGEAGRQFKGRGPKVVELNKQPGPALLWVRHTGYTPFSLSRLTSGDQAPGALVSAGGRYQGARLLDFGGGQTDRLQMETLGGWEIRLAPLAQAHPLPVPGEAQGRGDDVLAVAGLQGNLPPATLHVNARRASGRLVITAYSGDPQALEQGQPLQEIGVLVDQTVPYRGDLPLPSTTLVLVVQAEGEWSLEVTTP